MATGIAQGRLLLQSFQSIRIYKKTFLRFPDALSRVSLAGLVVGVALSILSKLYAGPISVLYNFAQDTENSADAAVTAKLDKKQFQNVKVSVENGVATFTGNVDLYEYKADADKRAHKVKGIAADAMKFRSPDSIGMAISGSQVVNDEPDLGISYTAPCVSTDVVCLGFGLR